MKKTIHYSWNINSNLILVKNSAISANDRNSIEVKIKIDESFRDETLTLMLKDPLGRTTILNNKIGTDGFTTFELDSVFSEIGNYETCFRILGANDEVIESSVVIFNVKNEFLPADIIIPVATTNELKELMKELEQVIDNGNITVELLDNKTEEAEAMKDLVVQEILKAEDTKNKLNDINDIAILTIAETERVTANSVVKNNILNETIVVATNKDDILKTTIADSIVKKENLQSVVNDSVTKRTELNATINNANSSNVELKSTTTTADASNTTLKATISDSIAKDNLLKTTITNS
ncbi:MAG: hypothetical protein ACRC6E_02540, partial [Fusobacteriaceae bacterium]